MNIIGIKKVQQWIINSSYFTLIIVDLAQLNNKRIIIIKETNVHNKENKNECIIIIEYSINNIIEKKIDVNSVIKPATNSDSASDKSNGTLLHSATILNMDELIKTIEQKKTHE